MAGVITQYGHEPAMAFTVVMLAGVFQILFGVSRRCSVALRLKSRARPGR